MSESTIPRIPGDPGHAGTFNFPVVYEVLKGFPFDDLITLNKSNIDILIQQALALQNKGVSLIATDCGLFGPFQTELRSHLDIPFIGSALDLVPLLQRWLSHHHQVGIITGDTRILQKPHLHASGIDPESVVLSGMDTMPEFQKVVIDQCEKLDVEKMRCDAVQAAMALSGKNLGAVVLECTNLISFRMDIQKVLKVPVFDLVSLIEFFVSGLKTKPFQTCFNC